MNVNRSSVRLVLVLLLFMPTCIADAAAVRWFIQHTEVDSHDLLVRIYGDDNNGLAGFKIHFRNTFAPDLDLINSSWDSPFETLDASFRTDALSIEGRVDVQGLGVQGYVNVGTLTIPGSTEASPGDRDCHSS